MESYTHTQKKDTVLTLRDEHQDQRRLWSLTWELGAGTAQMSIITFVARVRGQQVGLFKNPVVTTIIILINYKER